jgi:hypothetical protein
MDGGTVNAPNECPRITAFVEWFIRQDFVTPELQDLLMSDPERADRLVSASENGADGSTHQEVIDDWRNAFSHWIRYSRKGYHNPPERFIAAVEAHFDACEKWHEDNGTLDQEIG